MSSITLLCSEQSYLMWLVSLLELVEELGEGGGELKEAQV